MSAKNNPAGRGRTGLKRTKEPIAGEPSKITTGTSTSKKRKPNKETSEKLEIDKEKSFVNDEDKKFLDGTDEGFSNEVDRFSADENKNIPNEHKNVQCAKDKNIPKTFKITKDGVTAKDKRESNVQSSTSTLQETDNSLLDDCLMKLDSTSNIQCASEDTSLQETIKMDSVSEDADSDADTPKRRARKIDRRSRPGIKRIKTKKDRYAVTKKTKNDEVNKIQIEIATTQCVNENDGFTRDLVKSETLKYYVDGSKMTYRLMKRANFVIQTVRQEKVIVDLTKLMKLIKEDETNEGQKTSIDKKSLMRLIIKLSKDGYVKFRKATLKSEAKEKTVCFICDPDIDDDHSVITSALEQAKMKFFIGTKKFLKDSFIDEDDLPKNLALELVVPQKPENEEELKIGKMDYKYERNASKTYGLCPKVLRTRIIHELLYYLIYDNCNKKEPLVDRQSAEQLFKSWGLEDVFEENDRFSPVYHQELCWKLFIPPLPHHNGWPTGWTLMCDVLLRLPLQIFVKCFNVPYIIPELDHYLHHPIRKYFLVKNLPPKVRNGLMHARKYIFAFHEIVTRLCHMGLVQFGPQRLKEKDQVFVYLNRLGSLLDTVPSKSGYHQVEDKEYQRHSYRFESSKEVERYWYELWTICMNTNLGARTSVTGQTIVLEQASTKPALVEAMKAKLPEEVERGDNGKIPGDHRGAGGIDSALFIHLKRNWNWSDLLQYPGQQKAAPKKEKIEVELPPVEVPKKRVDKPKRYKLKVVDGKRRKVIRHVLPLKKIRNRKPFYDEKDKRCLKKMSKLRTDWTQVEDNVLLLCTVAQIYLCPNRRKQSVEYTVMRDILHSVVPYSNDKTSRSCQRRINYIMKNIKTRRSVQMCLEEIRQCEFVVDKFGMLLRKYHDNGVSIPGITLNVAFVELVAYMNRKFSNQIPTTTKPLCALPDTIQEVRELYDFNTGPKKGVQVFRDVETVKDIQFDVVRSVIHSSMCCSKDKTSWSFQLFKIYQHYPEPLLRSVISKIRHDQMVSVKKSYVRNQTIGSCLPLSSSPFQLSITYAYQLQSNRYRYESFNEANHFLKTVRQWSSAEEKTLEITTSDSGTSMLISDVMEKLEVDFKFEHPDQVIVLDPVITNDTVYERIVERYNEILKDPSKVGRAESDEDEFEQRPSVVKSSSTRIAFHMMRAQMDEEVDKNSAQHIHDYFVVNASRVFLETSKKYEGDELSKMDENAAKVLENFRNEAAVPETCKITADDVKCYFPEVALTNEDLSFVEKIKCRVCESGELGATVESLLLVQPDSQGVALDLSQVLDVLRRFKVVFRVGVTTARYIHFDNRTPWVVNSDKMMRLEREKMTPSALTSTKWKGKRLLKNEDVGAQSQRVKLLISPWVRLDGSLNRRVLDRGVGSVLSYILEEPGITLGDLEGRYDYLKPVEVLGVVENLKRLECVRLIKVKKGKVTLFSREEDYDFVEATLVDDPREVIVEPLKDAVFKFAVFLGDRNYNYNFFD